MLKELQPRTGSELEALSAQVLGRLLVMQSIIGSLPDEESIFSFACQGLLDVPGVAEARYVKSSNEATSDSLRRFPIASGQCDLGELLVSVSDPAALAPYESYLENFCAMVAVILEERRQREINELQQIELERRVKERTADLAKTNTALRSEMAERNRAEEELRQRHNESEAIRKVISATATSIELATVLDQALRGVLSLTRLEGGTVCLIDFQNHSLELRASINTSPETIRDLTSSRIKIGECLCGQCANTCEPLILWDNASSSVYATHEATRNEGIRFHASFPLKAKGRCIGVLCVFAKSEIKPSEHSLDLVQDLCGPIALAIENSRLFEAANRELAERKQAENELQRTNRMLHMISECNQVLVRAAEESDWLHAICRIVVEHGGYRLAWVGLPETDEAKTVRPVAQAGFDEGYIDTLETSWADTERGRGPAGTAIRTAQPCLIRNTFTDEKFLPWREEALKRGYASSLGLPLLAKGQTFGVLMIYAAAPDAFDETEIKLLSELADDLAFGLASIRILADRDRLFNLSLDPLCIAAFDGYLKQVNPSWSRIFGWSEFELLSHPWLDFVHPDDRAATQQIGAQLTSGQPVVGFENRYRCKDGTYRWVSWNSFPLPEARTIFAVVRDITERKRAEAALQTSEARLRAIIETEPECVKLVAKDGRLLEINPAGLAMIEADQPEQVIGGSIYGLLAPEYQTAFRALAESVCQGKPGTMEFEIVGLKGTRRWMETHAVPFRRMPEGETCLLAVTRDVTQRKRAEAELTKYREHLEELVGARTADLQMANHELEAFSYSVSHDLRAPIRAIEGYAHILLEDYTQSIGSDGQRVLDVICHQTAFMSQLIDDLLAFSRTGRQSMQTSQIDMDALAQEVFREQSALNPKSVVEFKIDPLPPALADRAMIRVALTNLLSNAFKYSRGRTPSIIEVGSFAQGAKNVYFVKDNGVGFDMKYAGKLFGVFQRLHSATEFEGTGVGLALVQRIIQRHGGRVWAEGKLNEGATFYFSLSAPPNI